MAPIGYLVTTLFGTSRLMVTGQKRAFEKSTPPSPLSLYTSYPASGELFAMYC